jgi:UDP-N-acetylglucosamine acyltransferase
MDDFLIHPTAIIHPDASLAPGVSVGPYSIIHEHVKIGAHTRIGAHCVIEGYTTLGEHNHIFTGAVIGSIPQDLKFRGEKSELVIGNHNRVREYVTINPGTEGGGGKTVIGDDCLFMAYSHVAHDCIIGNRVVLANSTALAGHITVEDRAIVGGLCGVHQFVRIGTLAMVGGCSRVIQDVPPYATCVGMPARIFGVNSEGMRRAEMSDAVKEVLQRAYRVLFYSKLPFRKAVDQALALSPDMEELKHLCDFIRESKRGVCRASNVKQA